MVNKLDQEEGEQESKQEFVKVPGRFTIPIFPDIQTYSGSYVYRFPLVELEQLTGELWVKHSSEARNFPKLNQSLYVPYTGADKSTPITGLVKQMAAAASRSRSQHTKTSTCAICGMQFINADYGPFRLIQHTHWHQDSGF